MTPEILFEDRSILAINKPAGLMVEHDKFNNPSLEGWVAEYVKEKRVSQNTIIGIVHRIDRPVSGVVLFSKKISVLRDLNKQFEEGKVEKIYFAIVENKPPKKEELLQHYIFKDAKNKKAIIYKNNRKSAVKCELMYNYVEKSGSGHLLEIHPLTGKYHQIRAQLSFIGCPIIGDEKYGSQKKYRADEICLHAHSIEIMHPVENKKIKIVSALPENWKF